MRLHAIDVESIPDLCAIVAKDRDTAERTIFSSAPEVVGGHPLAAFRPWLDRMKTETIFASINGIAYDNRMCRIVYDGEYDPAVLKQHSDAIINDPEEWKNRRKNVAGELHCDLLAMNGGMEQVSGAKELAIKANLKSVRESNVSWDAAVTTDAQKREFIHVYNAMDLDVVIWAAHACQREIDIRLATIDEFHVDVLSEADAGLADQVMRSQLYPTGDLPYPNQIAWHLSGQQLANKVRYEHPELRALQERIRALELDFELVYETEKGRAKKSIKGPRISEMVQIAGKDYRVAKGGLHSDDAPGFFVADRHRRIISADFKGFYPSLILAHALCPQQVPKHPFLRTFKTLVDKRSKAKSAGDKTLADALKIATNSIFGKSGSPYSWLCDPIALFSCTLLGQLTILELIDLLVCGAGDYLEIISANTDSVTMMVDVDMAAIVIEFADTFANSIGQTLEWTEYSRLVRRDINNYVAFGLDGKIVTAKGAYQYQPDRIKGKAVNRICVDAAQAYFMSEIPVADTVRACQDIRQFVDYRKCQRTHVLADSSGVQHGSVARWYVGTTGLHLGTQRLADGQWTQVAQHAVLIPDLPDTMPTDLDYDHYIAEAEALVLAITDPPRHDSHVIPVTELSAAQRAQHVANQSMALTAWDTIALDRYRADYARSYRGNQRDSMKGVLLRIWWAGEGTLTQGDLLRCARELDDPIGYFAGSKARNLEQMVEWIAYDISAFPKPRSTLECATLALAWADEHVERCKVCLKGKKGHVLLHTPAVVGSNFVTNDAVRKFAASGNEYKLACSVASILVKHLKQHNTDFIVAIIDDVRQYITGKEAELTKPQSALQKLRERNKWNYFSSQKDQNS